MQVKRINSNNVLFVIFLIASISLLFSGYWLRPLTFDGGRITLTTLQFGMPYSDFPILRYLQCLYQIPMLLLVKLLPSLSPLVAARVYFLTIHLSTILIVGWQVLRCKDPRYRSIVHILFFVAFLPGATFAHSLVFETVTFFGFSALALYKQRFSYFIIFAIMAALGHPLIIIAFAGLTIILLLEITHYKKSYKKYLWSCIGLLLFTFFKLWFTLFILRNITNGYFDTFTQFLMDPFSPNHYSYALCILTAILLIADQILFARTIRRIVWLSGILTVICFFVNPLRDGYGNTTYPFRVFSVGLCLFLLLYGWYLFRFKKEIKEHLLFAVFAIVSGSWTTYQDLQITSWYREMNRVISETPTMDGCYYHTLDRSIYPIGTSLPLFKMFLLNKKEVTGLMYSEVYDEKKEICSLNNAHFLLLTKYGDSKYGVPIKADGFFKLQFLLANQQVAE